MPVALIVLLATLVAAQTSAGQVARPLKLPAEFTVDQWTTVNGLPQNSVNAIAQTPDGYVWVGTFGGLARFDGLRFVLIERTDSAGRHVDRVLSLAVAPDSALWIGTENGLLRYAAGRFVRFTASDGLPDREIHALHFDRTGRLWVGTERGAARYENGRFVRLPPAAGVLATVASFAEGHDGVLWVNSNGRFVTLDQERRVSAPTRELTAGGLLGALLEDRDSVRWFVKRDGVAGERLGRVQQFHVGFGPEIMIEQEIAGRYWWATPENGVQEFYTSGTGGVQPYPLPDGTITYGARALLDGHDGNVWAGTVRDGLLRLKRNLFTTYRARHGLSNDIVTPVMEARDGSLWAGTNCGGVNVIDPARQSVRTYRIPGERGGGGCIFSLAQDSSGAVWVGTWGWGLVRIENGVAQHMAGLGAIADSVIFALFTDRRGTLWVGTSASGLAEVRAGKVSRIYTTAQGLAHNSVRVIKETRDGDLWIGTLEGLSRLRRDGRITTYTAKDGLSSEYVRAIHEGPDGTLWFGTYGGGLNLLRDGRFVAITRSDGLADNVVSSVLEDGRGNLWMSGNTGIFRVAKQQLHDFADGKLRHVHSVLYGVADGLVNAETNGGFQPAAWKDRSGRLWFPAIEGLASVDPERAVDIPRPPTVTVDEVVIDGEVRPLTQAMRVGPGRPNIEFRYSGVSLSSPENVTFRYKLERLDPDWIEPGTRRVAYYSRLPAGEYRFLVTAANRDGLWNPNQASMNLVVLAPLYRRAWFIVLMTLAMALILWTAHRAVLRSRTAAVADERSRLAREIHDSLLQGFVGIALQLHAASTRLALPPSQQPLIDRVLAMIDRTLTQARHAVWDLRPTGETVQELGIECQAAADRILAGSATTSRVVTRGRERSLNPIAQTECLRIVEEALTNVRKHADARHAVVLLDYRLLSLRVTIRDDGKGCDPALNGKQPGHWGWLGMRERATRIGSRLVLESTPGTGTLLRVDVPYRSRFLAWARRRAIRAASSRD
jgi:signal transduction histidine kinase/ligand-binding sensor domain-containing protein